MALGGEPTMQTRAANVADGNRRMLEEILAAEKRAVGDYIQRAKEAEEYGDKGLAVQLEDFVRDETTHLEETERILKNWPL